MNPATLVLVNLFPNHLTSKEVTAVMEAPWYEVKGDAGWKNFIFIPAERLPEKLAAKFTPIAEVREDITECGFVEIPHKLKVADNREGFHHPGILS